MYKGVIFDLDGTLVDSIVDIKNSMNRALANNNLEENDLQFYVDHIGQGLYKLTEDSTKGVKVEEVYNDLLKDYSENYLIETKPYAGMLDLVNKLVLNNILVGVNSNKKDEYTKEIVKKLFPNIDFVKVIGDREGVNKKPDPISANEIISAMGLDKKDVVYVGDTDHDMHTALNANIDSIGVTWGYRSKEQLEQAHAVHIADNMTDLELILIG